ncbi:MAG: magnesium/cobalt transporter CorA [Bacteroidetes bacterium]|nr:magnesium/cobalt transporter CorA [Bacteroidota bacterium]HET6245465.1 magnesium/cobalt transporter CorA [Bacteroidia bacterium]
MAKFTRRYNRKRIGLSPGSIDHITTSSENYSISAYCYGEDILEKKELVNPSDLEKLLSSKKGSVWININGLNTSIVDQICSSYKIHPLFVEDILHLGQRPKLEEGENYLFLVLNMINFDTIKDEVIHEQVSIIFNQEFIISFQELEGDVFDPVRLRLEAGKGKIRKSGTDYLAYALLDVIVDRFYLVLEQLGNKIEMLEEKVLDDPSIELLYEINRLKRDFILLRKNIWPLREVLNSLMNNDMTIVSAHTRVFIKDVYDHTIQVMDSIDTYREMLSSILDIYMSSISNRQNDVMKTLTIIATIFIPLTFLVGVYGMNFRVMPELDWEYGYYTVWGIMIIVGLSLLLYFKRKNWM